MNIEESFLKEIWFSSERGIQIVFFENVGNEE